MDHDMIYNSAEADALEQDVALLFKEANVRGPSIGIRHNRRRQVQANPSLWPKAADVTTVPEFIAGLACIKRSTGLSFDRLAVMSVGNGFPLSKSTIYNMCSPKHGRLPHGPRQVDAFLQLCGARPQDRQEWGAAWQRLVQQSVADSGNASTAEQSEPREVTGGTSLRISPVLLGVVVVVSVLVGVNLGLLIAML